MTLARRAFLITAIPAGFLRASRRDGIILEAVSAAQLPHTLVIPALPAGPSAFFEWREYRASSPACLDRLHRCFIRGAFAHCGLQPLLWKSSPTSRVGRHYLFPFPSLATRGEAWTAFASDPAWSKFRESVQVTAVSVYRRLKDSPH